MDKLCDIFKLKVALQERNSKLDNEFYDLPNEVIEFLKETLSKYSDHKTVKGYKRANHLVNNPNQPFVNLVMIKHYFDNLNIDEVDPIEYNLNGGEIMDKWVQGLIKSERERVKGEKVARTNAGMDKQFRQDNKDDDFDTSLGDRIMDTPDLMTNSALLENINKIKNLMNKI
jgi:hypothetical protein